MMQRASLLLVASLVMSTLVLAAAVQPTEATFLEHLAMQLGCPAS